MRLPTISPLISFALYRSAAASDGTAAHTAAIAIAVRNMARSFAPVVFVSLHYEKWARLDQSG